jgi:UDP-glucose 4-epimerase
MKVLVLGGAGYIGSHTCLALGEHGHQVVVADNLVNGSTEAVRRVSALLGADIPFHHVDARDAQGLLPLMADADAVIHFAALKAVGESCAHPLRYFDNNIGGTIGLLQAMQEAGTQRIVFSSSATVYGMAEKMPVSEDSPLGVTNPYGRTKLVAEQLIGDLCTSHPRFTALLLRYFNPVGAHHSGDIGEDPNGIPNNLMPFVAQVAVGRRKRLRVFGGDYPTRDGTGIRDYVHVMDLARAHVSAVEATETSKGCSAINLGTGRGYSVLEVVKNFENASGRSIPYEIVARRPGDVSELWADPSLAREMLGWEAEFDLQQMCIDAWRWQSQNPDGYGSGS